jgi:hypothetical protein
MAPPKKGQRAAQRPGQRGAQRPPDGKVRLSQVVTTFGPGAMVDLLDHAVLVGGTDFWRYDKLQPDAFIAEPRLYDAISRRLEAKGIRLNVGFAFRKPPAGDDQAAMLSNGIPVVEFPTWFVCQECRALTAAKNLEKEKQRYIHRCSDAKRGTCVPVRFVAACPKGHLEEFPWVWFHTGPGKEPCEEPDLFLEEDASGDLSNIVVACRTCKQRRSLSTAREPLVLPLCRGDRPWLGFDGRDPKGCDEHLNLLVRTATSAYFTQSMSALWIPDKARELQDELARPDLWKVVQEASAADLPMLRKVVPIVRNSLAGYTDEAVMTAIETIRGGKAAARPELRTAEFDVFCEQPEVEGAQPPDGSHFFARRLPEKEPLPDHVERIVLAKKLRQVRAQIGLTRLSSATPNLQGEYDDASRLQPVGLNSTWLPAVELFGEGVLICLDEAQVKAWENRPEVLAREEILRQGYAREFQAGGQPFLGARYYLLHSLSHLLISSISLSCGYSAASLAERIYCAPAHDPTPMAAILIMTGSPGSEGTLGGLIEQGRELRRHLRHAFDLATLCSNDPVCAYHQPGGHSGRHLEGAACHACLFIAEPACERFNRFLDRALVVPTMAAPGCAFFQERP